MSHIIILCGLIFFSCALWNYLSQGQDPVIRTPASCDGVDRISLEESIAPKQSNEWSVPINLFASSDAVRPLESKDGVQYSWV